MTSKHEITALASELQIQFQKVQERKEFLALKENETELGGDLAHESWFGAMQECQNERLLLDGHAALLEQMIRRSKIKPSKSISLLLARIHAPPGVRVY